MDSRQIVQDIQKIGQDYLEKHPVSWLNWTHHNQSTAKRLSRFNPQNPNKDMIEQFIVDCYTNLPNLHGEMASSLQNIFFKEFGKVLNRDLLIEKISKQTLQRIGKSYLAWYPEATPWYRFFRAHTNQTQAQTLVHCAMKDANTGEVIDKPSYKQYWYYLANIYANLPHTGGYLASLIEDLFEKIFERTLTRIVGGGENVYFYPPAIVAIEMRDIMKKRFAELDKNQPLLETTRPAFQM